MEEHIVAFPNTDILGQRLRPWFLALLFMIPALGAWLYCFSGNLDRYISKQFLTAFFLSLLTLLGILVLSDLQNHADEFYKTERSLNIALRYYGVFVPSMVVFIFPYVLLLSLLYSLGKMSRHQEIVSMIQTGRGIFRIVQPLIIVGIFSSLVCLIYNYQWGPSAEGDKKFIMNQARKGDSDRANGVLYRDVKSKRVWLVGSFPSDFEKTGMMSKVLVTSFDDGGSPTKKLEAEVAHWSREDRTWTFTGLRLIDLRSEPVPRIEVLEDSITKNWHETPWQIIKPALDYTHQGTPDLNAWLRDHPGSGEVRRSRYLTQWHHRIAQPLICLVTILLAAPLGIAFSRNGLGGGVSVAILLGAGMLFSSNFFLTFGESGYLPPMLAAWSTNLLFALVGFYLFKRRISGLPILSSLKRLFSSGG